MSEIQPGGTFKAAAIQMVSTPDVADNLSRAGALIADAARQGARVVGVPEYFCVMGMKDSDKVAVREIDGKGPIQNFLAETAAKNKVWIIGGTVPLECPDPAKVLNTTLVYNDRGERVARYDKIHLFGFDNGTERYQESRTIAPGSTPVAFDTPLGRMGLSICYDLRFPELYRAFGTPDLIWVPSAFTATTGKAHWEPLLRARAIENLAYVIAPAQGGKHVNGRSTHGHSMIIDPWGAILAERDSGEGVVIADIDLSVTTRMRGMLPALEHRVL
jgi:predicted amidohydrolase